MQLAHCAMNYLRRASSQVFMTNASVREAEITIFYAPRDRVGDMCERAKLIEYANKHVGA